jgi:hypothetical protein
MLLFSMEYFTSAGGNMRSLSRVTKLFALVLVPLVAALAQVTIDTSDVQAQFKVGTSITFQYDSTTKSVNVGNAGFSSWDFSSFRSDSSQALLSVTVGSTPFGAQFPGSTHALKATLTYQGIDATVYYYFTLTPTSLWQNGLMGEPTGGGSGTSLKDTYTPADRWSVFPSSINTSWTSAYTDTQIVTLFGVPQTPVVVSHNITYIIDGYGPMKLPDGKTYDALRIRKQDRRSNGTIAAYLWLSKNGVSVQVGTVDTLSTLSGTIAVNTVQWNGPVTAVAVAASNAIPVQYALEQNYPNPFNPSTTITYALPDRSQTTLLVYNTLGQMVRELVNGEIEAGYHEVQFNASGLASGVYLYRMQARDFIQTRTLLLLR